MVVIITPIPPLIPAIFQLIHTRAAGQLADFLQNRLIHRLTVAVDAGREPSYASDIIQKLKEAQLIVVEGTLYPLLTRLKNDDLLSYEWVESTQGPPRKYYKLTEQGEVFLGELEISWKELNETVNHIANR